MSTITSLQSSDSGSVSMGVINTNFTNLNTDKIEDDSADTLTNKTIDVDNNTVSNIETDNLKSSAKSGSDTTVITGTAGDTDELTKWNADGDLVTTDVTITTTAPTTTSTDTTIPTSQAVQEAITAQFTNTKQFFVPVLKHSADAEPYDDAVIGDFATSNVDAAASVYFAFRVPDNFTTLTSANVVCIPDASETVQYDVDTDYGALGQNYNTHTETVSNATSGVTSDLMAELTVAGALTSIAAGDYVGLKFTSDTTQIRVVGLFIKYT